MYFTPFARLPTCAAVSTAEAASASPGQVALLSAEHW